MDRTNLMLAALAAGGENTSYTPVQVQKLFFLIDREVAQRVGGPHFAFRAYDYGPFDRAVYDALDVLELGGFIHTHHTGRYRVFELSPEGYRRGVDSLAQLDPLARGYLEQVASWVRRLNFQQLVAAIYKRYPEMKANSVFS
jgi:hypothetical protein